MCNTEYENQQLRAIYTNPGEISSEQNLLEQVKEFVEIGFNKNFKKFIESNKSKIKLFTSPKFDAAKYSKEYLDFLNALILALPSAEGDIDTKTIRKKHSLNQFYSRQKKTSQEYEPIQDIIKDSTLATNVIERLNAFKEQLEAIRNQQLILQAKSLVANSDIDVNQENLRLMKSDYLKLCSNYSLKSLAAFDQKFELLFGEKSISTFRKHFAERKRIMDAIMEACKGMPVAKVIREEKSKLDKQIEDFDLIMNQATELWDLKTRLQQIKTIESSVTEKVDVLLIPSDPQKLREFIEFIAGKEKEIQRIKEGIHGSAEIHQNTKRAIGESEQYIRQKREQAEFFLQQISNTRSEAPQQRKIDESQESVVFTPKESSPKSDKKNEEALAVKKARLQEAISLIQTYRKTIEKEQKRFSVKFYKSRHQEKSSYCLSLERELRLQDNDLKFESNLHDIINNAHKKVTAGSGAKKEIITKGGSYFGTSRMLGLQRLLGIDEAWQTKGHSKFLVFSTQSDFHGLKTMGVVGDNVHKIVENFYLGVDNNSNEEYQRIKEQAFPKDVASSPQCY